MSEPPEKKGAASSNAATRKELTELPEGNIGSAIAQACTHPVRRTERFPGGIAHYSHEVCAACGRHLRWHSKPQNVERRKFLAAYVARLLTCPGLSPWERSFVHDVSQRRKLSPRQQSVVERLAVQHLEEGAI